MSITNYQSTLCKTPEALLSNLRFVTSTVASVHAVIFVATTCSNHLEELGISLLRANSKEEDHGMNNSLTDYVWGIMVS
jgi:hypothetical protein